MTSHVVTSDPTLATRTFFSLPAPQSTQVPSTLFWFIEQKSELLLHVVSPADSSVATSLNVPSEHGLQIALFAVSKTWVFSGQMIFPHTVSAPEASSPASLSYPDVHETHWWLWTCSPSEQVFATHIDKSLDMDVLAPVKAVPTGQGTHAWSTE
jgi:hypothetical protein